MTMKTHLLAIFFVLCTLCNHAHGSQSVEGEVDIDIDIDIDIDTDIHIDVIGDPNLDIHLGRVADKTKEQKFTTFIDFRKMTPTDILQLFVSALQSGESNDLLIVDNIVTNIEGLQSNRTQNEKLKQDILVRLLIWGIQRHYAGTVAHVLQSGIDPNVTDESGTSALMHAIRSGDAAFVALLLNKGANPKRPENISCLDDALERNYDQIVLVLQAFGVVRAKRDNSSKSFGSVSFLESHMYATATESGSVSGSELFDAIARKEDGIVQQLLDRGGLVFQKNGDQKTPRMFATELLSRDADERLERIVSMLRDTEEIRSIVIGGSLGRQAIHPH
ncbi:MAG: hypothetical protein HQK53_02335 [Oligoflexia bacterium]|nr:hypothetical protein [Oligoflexia bacterium]